MTGVKIIPRRSDERGHADHDWLKTFHTFAFANYSDIEHQSFGALRVLNEDRVKAHTGFGTHSHREFEIFSYVVSGELEHSDSMGNTEILPRGALQMTSTGTGISHSEKAHGNQEVHFCQIWAMPRPGEGKGKPAYFTRNFTDGEKLNKFALLVAPSTSSEVSLNREDKGPAPVRSQLRMYAALIEPGATIAHTFSGKARKGYVHVIQKSGYNPKKAGGARLQLIGGQAEEGEVELREGDGGYLLTGADSELKIENTGEQVAEVLLFDLE
ncbi:pirin domain-containing protein [Leucogyrophana mollusca]|uniref:Pirin domain-containing protein n=1 Tax=Leucogyrophana mollusca TaxID=85980 RepID=A0ACB8B104_9AGAM|nr:pirin domain-containing protein [Leucogyrophana mollusca]